MSPLLASTAVPKHPVWICGCNGMLARELALQFNKCGISQIGSDREIDITDLNSLENFAARIQPSFIVNCAAYTAVDRAESEPEAAYKVNAIGPANLATIAEKLQIPIIHFSTDYVFDGLKTAPWTEEDTPNPLSVYGKTKLEGENKLLQTTRRFFLFRISWLYGKYGANFVYTMLRLLNEKHSLKVVADQIGSPTWTGLLAENLAALIARNDKHYGIYHYSDEGIVSWHGFAEAIRDEALKADIIKKYVPIEAIESKDYPTAAQRPKNSAFEKHKVKNLLNFKVAPWQENLKSFIKSLKP